jgi:protein tyrosine/serine phosphatase
LRLLNGQLVPRIRNYSQVTPQLYRGGQPNETGFHQLKCLGVQIVVNLRSADEADHLGEEAMVKKLGMEYVSIPSICRKTHDEHVAGFLSLVRDHPDKKIFVHCEFGIDRTGLMIAAYRMAEDGWTQKKALAEMRLNGFNWMHQVAWCPETYHYEQHFLEKLKEDSALQGLIPAKQPPTQ